jgi:hypothetical protein
MFGGYAMIDPLSQICRLAGCCRRQEANINHADLPGQRQIQRGLSAWTSRVPAMAKRDGLAPWSAMLSHATAMLRSLPN